MSRLSDIRARCDAGRTVRITDTKYLLAEIERLQGELQDQEYQLSLDAMEQSRDEAIARAEQAEAERDTYKAALENWHEEERA